jgi:hypothetical protein
VGQGLQAAMKTFSKLDDETSNENLWSVNGSIKGLDDAFKTFESLRDLKDLKNEDQLKYELRGYFS